MAIAYANSNQLLLQACANDELATAAYSIPPGWMLGNVSGLQHIVVAWIDSVVTLRVVRQQGCGVTLPASKQVARFAFLAYSLAVQDNELVALPLSNGDWSGNNGAGFLTSSDACGGGGADLTSAEVDLVHGVQLYERTTFQGFAPEQGGCFVSIVAPVGNPHASPAPLDACGKHGLVVPSSLSARSPARCLCHHGWTGERCRTAATAENLPTTCYAAEQPLATGMVTIQPDASLPPLALYCDYDTWCGKGDALGLTSRAHGLVMGCHDFS